MAIRATNEEARVEVRLALMTKFFRALGDPSRLKILSSLLDGEKNVGELVDVVGASQGRVSNHLACLKQCGFVNARRDAKFIYYSIADEEVRRLLEICQSMIARNAERIWACTQVVSGEDPGNNALTCPGWSEAVPPKE